MEKGMKCISNHQNFRYTDMDCRQTLLEVNTGWYSRMWCQSGFNTGARFLHLVIAPTREKETKILLETAGTFATLSADMDWRQTLHKVKPGWYSRMWGSSEVNMLANWTNLLSDSHGRLCLLKMNSVLQIALLNIFRCAVGVHFVSKSVQFYKI